MQRLPTLALSNLLLLTFLVVKVIIPPCQLMPDGMIIGLNVNVYTNVESRR